MDVAYDVMYRYAQGYIQRRFTQTPSPTQEINIYILDMTLLTCMAFPLCPPSV